MLRNVGYPGDNNRRYYNRSFYVRKTSRLVEIYSARRHECVKSAVS